MEWNHLTVFVVQVGEFNPAFEQFLKFINGIKYRGESKVTEFLFIHVAVMDFTLT